MDVVVIGGGLAGSEAAYQLARRGHAVTLIEQRPAHQTPVHKTGDLAELVCSNSLGGMGQDQAKGLLQAEMRLLGSVIMAAADQAYVPAGGALAVDRVVFAKEVTERLGGLELVRRDTRRVEQLSEGPAIIATGPLTDGALAKAIEVITGRARLHFFDAASPIVSNDSLDHQVLYRAARYGKGEGEYLNAPLNQEQYQALIAAVATAEVTQSHLEGETSFFEGCIPLEERVRRGADTLRFGALKPVGLPDPRTGHIPYAVAQLRPEDKEGRMWSLVGFQTGLKWGEQKRIVHMIPGLEQAEILRYGVMHRNTYLNAPDVLRPTLQAKARADLFFAGQLTGVEGYLESAAMGLVAGVNLSRLLQGLEPLVLPPETMLGGLERFLTEARSDNFQPMNANWGLVPPLDSRLGRQEQRQAKFRRGIAALQAFIARHGLAPDVPFQEAAPKYAGGRV